MPEHFTKNTESIWKWCNRCERNHDFPVSNGHIRPCPFNIKPGPSKKQISSRLRQLEAADRQPTLFPK